MPRAMTPKRNQACSPRPWRRTSASSITPMTRPAWLCSENSLAATGPATAGEPSVANSVGTARKLRAVMPPHQRAASISAARGWAMGARSGVAHRHDLVAADAARGLHLGGVALFLADQCACDRAADVDEAVLEVGLVLADDLVGHGSAAVFVREF